MKYLILFLISLNCFANYAPLSEVQSKNITKVYLKRPAGNFIKLPIGYNPAYYDVVDEMIDDIEKPIYSKSEAEACADQADCEAKNAIKVCADNEETVLMSEDFSEIYCSKLTGYEQKSTGNKIVVENASLKATYEAQQLAKKQKEEALAQVRKMREAGQGVIDLMILNNSAKGLTDQQRKTVLETYSGIKALLEVGNLPQAKIEINAITPDGVLVTEQDKADLVAKIDKHLN
jgi:hypothetical protein